MANKQATLMLRGSIITLDELTTSLGLGKALGILWRLSGIMRRGGAYAHLPPHPDPRINESREQLKLAVNLYQALQAEVDEASAYRITRRIVLLSSVMYLRTVYPSFESGDFTKLVADGDPNKAAARLSEEFPFADTEARGMSKDAAGFDVVRCRIPIVLAEVGAERLAPIFCEVDRIYFPIYAPEVELTRTQTLVHGGTHCDFRFRFKDR